MCCPFFYLFRLVRNSNMQNYIVTIPDDPPEKPNTAFVYNSQNEFLS